MSQWTTAIYLFYMAKSFTPFLSFMVPYLIDSCKFTNKEVYNKLNPFFFLSSLVMSLLSFFIIEKFGNINSLIFDVLLEIIVYVLFFWRPVRNYPMAILVCSLHGASTSMNSVLKYVLINTSPDAKEAKTVIANTQTFRTIIGILSFWMGQDIYIYSREHRVNIVYSTMGLCIAFGSIFLLPGGTQTKQQDGLLSYLSSFTNFIKCLKSAYDSKTIAFSLAYINCSILAICLSFFSANVFLERKKKSSENLSNLNMRISYLMKPFRWLSYYMVRLYNILGGTTKPIETTECDMVIHGYVDGFAKLFSAILGYIISIKMFKDEHLPTVSMILNVSTMFALYFFGIVKSLALSYLFFIVAYSLSSASRILALALLPRTKYSEFVMSINMTISCLIHILLSTTSLFYSCSAQTRFHLYFTVCAVLISTSIYFFYN